MAVFEPWDIQKQESLCLSWLPRLEDRTVITTVFTEWLLLFANGLKVWAVEEKGVATVQSISRFYINALELSYKCVFLKKTVKNLCFAYVIPDDSSL